MEIESFIFFVRRLTGNWQESFEFFMDLGMGQFMQTFWAFFFLEIPRYIFTDLYVAVHHFFLKKAPPVYPPPNQPAPLVSIILSVLNEGDTIGISIISLREQDYPNIEIKCLSG
jgi:cellulose synthase/poly-beta-1,6-N-acetylglucosamine synthase-like glycosyltransferase